MKSKSPANQKPTCPFSKILSQMPPLSNYPDRSRGFSVLASEVVGFIRYRTGQTLSRSLQIFHQARINRILVFDHRTKLWRGRFYSANAKISAGRFRQRPPQSSGRKDS